MHLIARRIMLAALAGCGMIVPALGETAVVTRTETYAVSGSTARAMVQSMARNGPRHGFTARAIAQTSYTVDWQLKTERQGHGCRIREAVGTLKLTYIYPRVTSPMSRPLATRWKRFFAEVRKHEEKHGRIARDMVSAAEKAARSVSLARDPSCIRTRREAKRLISAAYAEFEAKQIAFDAQEHKSGGPVDRLVAAFVRE
jgi:predicted secreted Zn-dependent protease